MHAVQQQILIGRSKFTLTPYVSVRQNMSVALLPQNYSMLLHTQHNCSHAAVYPMWHRTTPGPPWSTSLSTLPRVLSSAGCNLCCWIWQAEGQPGLLEHQQALPGEVPWPPCCWTVCRGTSQLPNSQLLRRCACATAA
jgi:hypothetical protein